MDHLTYQLLVRFHSKRPYISL